MFLVVQLQRRRLGEGHVEVPALPTHRIGQLAADGKARVNLLAGILQRGRGTGGARVNLLEGADFSCGQTARTVALRQSRLLGSNWHWRGSSMSPSTRPSSPSQAAITALKTSGNFAVGIGVASIACMFQLNPTARPAMSSAGDPAMMPSKSAG